MNFIVYLNKELESYGMLLELYNAIALDLGNLGRSLKEPINTDTAHHIDLITK